MLGMSVQEFWRMQKYRKIIFANTIWAVTYNSTCTFHDNFVHKIYSNRIF